MVNNLILTLSYRQYGQIIMDKILIDNIVFQYDSKDYPKFTDTLILSADYDGKEMTSDQLDEINEDGEWVYEKLLEWLY